MFLPLQNKTLTTSKIGYFIKNNLIDHKTGTRSNRTNQDPNIIPIETLKWRLMLYYVVPRLWSIKKIKDIVIRTL